MVHMPSSSQDNNRLRDIYSVSRLNSEVRAVLDSSFPLLWVEGEISNLARPSSGHIYFSLKDQHSQVRCAMFRMKRQRLRFEPENGMQVLVRARPNLYEARGDFQLNIEHMEPGGEGLLRQAYEELKQRLDKEGLFLAEHKLELPTFPSQIGVVTSPSGAAIRDVLSVLKRRFPSISVVIYPVSVQGDTAAKEITQALQLANQRAECDVLILSRGGGSLEDLMAFNDEQVARAIFNSDIPIISAIGHEIDFTIADFVADQRAPTPSAAAELSVPDHRELSERLNNLQRHIRSSHLRLVQSIGLRMQGLEQRLKLLHPMVQLSQKQQRLDDLEQRISQIAITNLNNNSQTVLNLKTRLHSQAPAHKIALLQHKLDSLYRRLITSTSNSHLLQKQRLAAATRNMNALSPLATLERGYSITSSQKDGRILDDASTIKPGQRIETKLAKGKISSLVESTEET